MATKEAAAILFGFFRKKTATPAGLTHADLERSVTIAHEDILYEAVFIGEVRAIAHGLYNGPIPYSAHDLAVATALYFYRTKEHFDQLKDCQIAARLRVANWAADGKVGKGAARIFDDALYVAYKSQADMPRKESDDEEAFALFKRRNAGKPVHEVARIVRDFIIHAHNVAKNERPLEGLLPDQTEHAENMERAFLLGAVGMAADAFLIPAADETVMLESIIGTYRGLDEHEIDDEVRRSFFASGTERRATSIGSAAMIDYLLNGKSAENEFHLAALQEACWCPDK